MTHTGTSNKRKLIGLVCLYMFEDSRPVLLSAFFFALVVSLLYGFKVKLKIVIVF